MENRQLFEGLALAIAPLEDHAGQARALMEEVCRWHADVTAPQAADSEDRVRAVLAELIASIADCDEVANAIYKPDSGLGLNQQQTRIRQAISRAEYELGY